MVGMVHLIIPAIPTDVTEHLRREHEAGGSVWFEEGEQHDRFTSSLRYIFPTVLFHYMIFTLLHEYIFRSTVLYMCMII